MIVKPLATLAGLIAALIAIVSWLTGTTSLADLQRVMAGGPVPVASEPQGAPWPQEPPTVNVPVPAQDASASRVEQAGSVVVEPASDFGQATGDAVGGGAATDVDPGWSQSPDNATGGDQGPASSMPTEAPP